MARGGASESPEGRLLPARCNGPAPSTSQPCALRGHWSRWARRGPNTCQRHSPVARPNAPPSDPAGASYCTLNPFIRRRIQCVSERGTPSGANGRARLREACGGAAGTQAEEGAEGGDCAPLRGSSAERGRLFPGGRLLLEAGIHTTDSTWF